MELMELFCFSFKIFFLFVTKLKKCMFMIESLLAIKQKLNLNNILLFQTKQFPYLLMANNKLAIKKQQKKSVKMQ